MFGVEGEMATRAVLSAYDWLFFQTDACNTYIHTYIHIFTYKNFSYIKVYNINNINIFYIVYIFNIYGFFQYLEFSNRTALKVTHSVLFTQPCSRYRGTAQSSKIRQWPEPVKNKKQGTKAPSRSFKAQTLRQRNCVSFMWGCCSIKSASICGTWFRI